MFLAVFFIIFSPARSFCGQDIADKDCLSCHDDFKVKEYNISAHALRLHCASCHNDISEIPHPERTAKVNCSRCHNSQYRIYSASDHGKLTRDGISAADCLDCHGESHSMLPAKAQESPVRRFNIPHTCARCHEDEEKMAKYNLLEKNPVVTYSATVHGKALSEKGSMAVAVCTDCHGSHNLYKPTNPKSKIYRSNVPYTCGNCHKKILSDYLRSSHGKSAMSGIKDAPVCTDCHGEHTIKSPTDPLSSVYPTSIAKKTCGQCHAAEKIISKYHLPGDSLETYFQSYHGLASKFGVTTVANCGSCHGVHDILPSSDPDSSIHEDNLVRTCGKCHQNVGSKITKGKVHSSGSLRGDRAVFYVSRFYIFLIIMTIGGMLAHNILYFIPNLRAYYRKHKEEAKYIRFTKSERLQHFLLLSSFILLAYTGFALRYRTAWWAAPFTIWNPGFDWRGVIHRIMAVIFTGLAAYHVYYLFSVKRGKEQLAALLFKKKDWSYFIKMTRYNLGIERQRPKEARYNYTEKVEYWALVWGSVVMIATGSALTFSGFFLRHFPKWMLDVARVVHYYEALLAVLAIIIWHLYFVIFDPAHYPINLSMITGRTSKEHIEEGNN